jgi:hypothetical protein
VVASGSQASASDLDDASIPLLTPTDDVADEGEGLPIVLDLGPEPPLRSPTARPARSWRAAAPSQTDSTAPAKASPNFGDPDLAPSRPVRRAPPAWVWWSIAAVILAGAGLGLLASTGKLGRHGEGRSGPTDLPRAKDQSGQSRTVAKKEPVIFICSHSQEADEEKETPAWSLKEAVKAAMGRGRDVYIELRNREPLVLEAGESFDMVSVPGTLEIRAGPGIQPVIEVPMGTTKPFLAIGSAGTLKLSGLTIHVRYPTPPESALPPPPPALIQAAGTLDIKACAFEVVGRLRPIEARALLMEGANLTLDRCWFLGFDAAIKVRTYAPPPGATPELRGWPLTVELVPGGAKSGTAERKLMLDYCTFEGAGFLNLIGGTSQYPLFAEIKHCAVRADALLAWMPPKPGDRLDVELKWHGLGNQLHLLGRDWIVQSAATMTPAFGLDVTDLPTWSKLVGHEDDPGPGRILYHTLPDVRPNPPSPQHFAIDPSGPHASPAGADPNKVGPWRK